jgi:glycosyltransferase involved in cell wall biosynthesis
VRDREPAVSVVLPVYNGAPEVGDAIESVLHQTLVDFELIVVDDGSTDATSRILGGFADPRIRVITHSENRGIVASLNEGIGAAATPFIARLDCDCRCYPDRLERQLAVFHEEPDVGLVTGPRYKITPNSDLGVAAPPSDHASVWFRLVFGNCIAHPTVMFRRSVFDDIGGYRQTWFPVEDYDLWLRMAPKTRFAVLRDSVIVDNVDTDGISGRLAESQRELSRALSRRAVVELTGIDSDVRILEGLARNAVVPCREFGESARLVVAAARAVRRACRARDIPTAGIHSSVTSVLRPSRFRRPSGRACLRCVGIFMVRHPTVALSSARRRLQRRR